MIEPIIENLEAKADISEVMFWVYAPFYSQSLWQFQQPSFNSSIYTNTNSSTFNMTETIFSDLYDNGRIFEELVFDYDIDGITYMAYSQSVPATATTIAEIEFFLFLLQNKAET